MKITIIPEPGPFNHGWRWFMRIDHDYGIKCEIKYVTQESAIQGAERWANDNLQGKLEFQT